MQIPRSLVYLLGSGIAVNFGEDSVCLFDLTALEQYPWRLYETRQPGCRDGL